jgi:hypothetical protein
MKITHLEIEGTDTEEFDRVYEIFQTLLDTGGLLGMKNGSTNIHFDNEGNFVGVQHAYWPWKKRFAKRQ